MSSLDIHSDTNNVDTVFLALGAQDVYDKLSCPKLCAELLKIIPYTDYQKIVFYLGRAHTSQQLYLEQVEEYYQTAIEGNSSNEQKLRLVKNHIQLKVDAIYPSSMICSHLWKDRDVKLHNCKFCNSCIDYQNSTLSTTDRIAPLGMFLCQEELETIYNLINQVQNCLNTKPTKQLASLNGINYELPTKAIDNTNKSLVQVDHRQILLLDAENNIIAWCSGNKTIKHRLNSKKQEYSASVVKPLNLSWQQKLNSNVDQKLEGYHNHKRSHYQLDENVDHDDHDHRKRLKLQPSVDANGSESINNRENASAKTESILNNIVVSHLVELRVFYLYGYNFAFNEKNQVLGFLKMIGTNRDVFKSQITPLPLEIKQVCDLLKVSYSPSFSISNNLLANLSTRMSIQQYSTDLIDNPMQIC